MAKIEKIAIALGSEPHTYQDLEKTFGETDAKRALTGTGIKTRLRAGADEYGSDFAFRAAQKVLAGNNQVDYLIHTTITPDYWFPPTACLLQERLGLPKKIGAFDINLGCSQYVYGLDLAQALIDSGKAKRVLLTTGDALTKRMNPKDKSVVPLFGDGGTATIVSAGEGLSDFILGTDGSGAMSLCIPNGNRRRSDGTELKEDRGSFRTDNDIYMDGAAIFNFAAHTAPELVKELQKRANIDFLILHQANKYMLDFILSRLKWPQEKTYFNIENIGNTSGSSVPILLYDCLKEGKIKQGMNVALVSFGVGLSWSACIYHLKEMPEIL